MKNFRHTGVGGEKDRDSGFGLRFRLLLGYHNLTLKDVSEVTGAAISTVSTWRNGRIPSSQEVISKIAQLFHVTPAYLLYGGIGSSMECDIDPMVEEISSGILQTPAVQNASEHSDLIRQKIKVYLECYLNEAEKYEGGLEHAWLQIRKEFPINWFRNSGIVPRSSNDEN